MAKFNSQQAQQSIAEIMKNAKQSYLTAVKEYKYECDHKTPQRYLLDDPNQLKTFNYNDPTRPLKPEDMICEDCKSIVNLDLVDELEAHGYFNGIEDMCNHIKLFVNLTEEEHDNIVSIMKTMDTVRNTLIPFYKKTVIDQNSGKKNRGGKKNNNGHQKGRVNIQSGYNR